MATSFQTPTPQANTMAPPPKRGSFGGNKTPSQTIGSISSTSNNIQGGSEEGSGETADGEDAAEGDHSGKADAAAPDMDKLRRRQSLATSEMGDDDSMSGALEQKMAELEASGWRPDEDNNFDITEDDDYKSVEDLSDWEGEDGHMRAQEEKMMWTGDREEGSMGADEEDALARRLSLSSTGSDLAYLAFNDDNYLFSETPFEQSLAHLDPDHLLLDPDVIFGDKTPLARRPSQDSTATQRRVRFQDEVDVSDGNTSDSDQENDFFPDLFVQQDHLDPTFRAMIENDHDLYMDDDSDAASCWDFEADEMRLLDMDDDDDDDDDDDSDSSAGSSGYESDDGDTTDEEAPPPPPKVEKVLEKEASPTSSSGSNATPKAARSSISSRKAVSKRASLVKQPKRGVFIMDPTRAVLTIEGAGKNQKHQFWPAKIQSDADRQFWNRLNSLATSRTTSRTTSPRMSIQLTPTEEGESTLGRHLSIDSSNAFFDESGALLADQVIGPAEAFLPFTSVSAGGIITFDDADQAIAGDDEDEQDPLSFLDFGSDDDEDEEMPDESDALVSPSTSSTFPHMSSATKSPGFDLLAHLDAHRGVVGSFRRNQQFARHVGSLPSHPAMRASTSESNAMQTGRRAAANTPITPMRKKKTNKAVVGARNSPILTSPLTKSPPFKRKGPARGGFSRH